MDTISGAMFSSLAYVLRLTAFTISCQGYNQIRFLKHRYMNPLLKQDWEIRSSDLYEDPVWMCVHGHDENEQWYEDTDEATFRPWDVSVQALRDRLLLVRVSMVLKNGHQHVGCSQGT